MKRLIICCIISIALLFGCAGSDVETFGDKIEATDEVKQPELSCLQVALASTEVFKNDFVYDEEWPPTVYVYISKGWHDLKSDNDRDESLMDIARVWYECNPGNMGPLTVMAYDSNDIPAGTVFMERGE